MFLRTNHESAIDKGIFRKVHNESDIEHLLLRIRVYSLKYIAGTEGCVSVKREYEVIFSASFVRRRVQLV